MYHVKLILLLSSLLLLAACGSSAPVVPEPAPPAHPEASAEPAEPARPEVYQNTIRWTTASEVENFGFDVYRALDKDGPFVRLNEETIAGGGTTDVPREYQFVDDTIDPYETYYYYVESISMSGEREMFTPVGEASPKLSREDR